MRAVYCVHIGEDDHEVKLRLMKSDEISVSSFNPVEILARSQLGGCGSMPELLPAYRMPNDSAIDRILKAASDVLRRAERLRRWMAT